MTLKNIYIFHFYLRWVNPLIKKGFNNELRMGDIYKWTFDSDATRLANKLEGYVMWSTFILIINKYISYAFNNLWF